MGLLDEGWEMRGSVCGWVGHQGTSFLRRSTRRPDKGK